MRSRILMLLVIISAVANENAAVSFTVYREGVSTAEPPIERWPWGT